MVKRRNAPYARHVPMNCTEIMLEALPVTVRKQEKNSNRTVLRPVPYCSPDK